MGHTFIAAEAEGWHTFFECGMSFIELDSAELIHYLAAKRQQKTNQDNIEYSSIESYYKLQRNGIYAYSFIHQTASLISNE